MVYAVYTLKDNYSFETDTLEEVQRAFAHNKVEFIRWAFSGSPADDQRPEFDNTKVGTIITLERNDDRVTVFATDYEIQTMFAILLNEGNPFQMVVSSNNNDQHTVDITFHPFVRK